MSETEQPHTRAPRACVQCKSKKIRCEPSKESSSICRRCYRLKQDCTVPTAKVRRSTSKVKARLEQLERTYGGIMQLLSERQGAGPARVNHTPLVAYLAPSTPIAGSGSDVTSSPVDNRSNSNSQPPLSLADAESLLTYYRYSLQDLLPLVVLAKDHTMAVLHEESPCLLMAILTICSWKQRTIQLRLEKQLLQNFATRYFEQGERSLDMLQALIVYICWIQFADATLSNNAYRLVSSAVVLVVDLGFDKPPSSAIEHGRARDDDRNMHDSRSSRFWSRAARRAFVTVYLLATTCSVSLRKDTAMKYSDYIEECALSLAESPKTPGDISWIHFVRLSRIGIEIKETLTWRQETSLPIDDDEINMLVKSYEQKLNAWRNSLPAEVDEHATTRIACSVRYAAIYEVGIYGITEGQSLSPIRITLLFKGIESIRRIIFTTLSLSPTTLETWSALNWRHLKYAVMLGSKIAIILDSVACDVESATRVGKLDIALEQLSARVEDLLVMCNNPAGQTHYYQQLLMEWQQMRKLYLPAKERLANLMNYVGSDTSVVEAPASVQPFTMPQSGTAVPDNTSTMPAVPWNFLWNMNDWTQDGFWLTPENCDAGNFV